MRWEVRSSTKYSRFIIVLESSSGGRKLTASASLWKRLWRIALEERFTAMENEELMQFLMSYGRWIPRDSIMTSHSIEDIIYYLRAEREFEIFKLSSFVTTNLFDFEKRGTFPVQSHSSRRDDGMGDPYCVDPMEWFWIHTQLIFPPAASSRKIPKKPPAGNRRIMVPRVPPWYHLTR